MRVVQLMASPFFGGPERQVLGMAAYSAAYRYLAAGKPWVGARRLVASFGWWPGGLAGVRYSFGRLRMLAACLAKAGRT